MTPLRIQVLFHWDSQEARRLARHVFETFSARPAGAGPRIPVRYGARCQNGGPPATLDLSAEHEIIVVLVDERMARRARTTDRLIAGAWADRVAQLVRDHGPDGASAHRVLPVALDAEALQLTPELNETSFVRLDVRQGTAKDSHLILHIAVRSLRLLQDVSRWGGQAADQIPDIPVRLFISHAKGDLPRDPKAMAEGPVKAILSALTQVPVEAWYDAAQIPPGGRFPDEIQKGVLKASALVAVLTDSWSTREWCRREVLEAKLTGRPIVVVDALQARVIRLFPYVGNAPTLRWRAAIAGPEAGGPVAEESWTKQRRVWEAEDIRQSDRSCAQSKS